LAHPKHHGGGGAEGVAVGADVGGDQDALAGGEGVDHLLVQIGHGGMIVRGGMGVSPMKS
jgi:hypothetical protein